MSEDPKTKLLLELITREVVMPTKHPEPTSSTSTFLRFKPHKFLSFSCLLSYTLLAVLWCQPCSSCTSPGKCVLGVGNDPGLRLHLLRNVVHQQQDSCQTPPSRSLSRNGVGLVFLLRSWFLRGSVVPAGNQHPGKKLQQRQGVRAALTPRARAPQRWQGQIWGGWGVQGVGMGKGKGSSWIEIQGNPPVREEAVQSVRAVVCVRGCLPSHERWGKRRN